MPFCERCGKQLVDGQICNCNANPNNGSIQPPPPIPYGAPPVYDQTVYTNNIGMTDPNAHKKSNVGFIILIIAIPLILIALVVCGILAAIFVPTMIGYTNKSKLVSQNSYSASISKAINSALTEMDEEGYKVDGNYFICSNVSNSFCFGSESDDLDYEDLYVRVNEFFAESENGEWFAVCENGVVTYVASSRAWDSDIVGTYPASSIDATKGYSRTYTEKQELGDIYDDTISDIYYY